VRGLLTVGGRVMLESVVANLAAGTAPTSGQRR